MHYIIDRRRNPQGKSLSNRQRFLRRAKRQVTEAVRRASAGRQVREIDEGEKIAIPADTLNEPRFRHDPESGRQDSVLSGNKHYREGDRIPRPQQSGRGGSEGDGSTDGEGRDSFAFVLSREEFLEIFLDDLELPDLMKKSLTLSSDVAYQRAGYATEGTPANISLPRTMANSLARRIALRRPGDRSLEALRAEIAELEKEEPDSPRVAELISALAEAEQRSRAIPYLDPIDIRYNRFEAVHKPVTQAVMFCLMDVSGSMLEEMKDLAKRFFMLLYLFIERRYRHAEIVFIRHTHSAQEVDEETFFYSRETGGTVVSTALDEMSRVIASRYPTDQWNIYAAQASDGDNAASDGPVVADILNRHILPITQYFAYVEVLGGLGDMLKTNSSLWNSYASLAEANPNFAMRRIRSRGDIYPVFRDLFDPARRHG